MTGRRLGLHPLDILLVGGGGVLGTAARLGLTVAVPDLGALKTTLFAINLTGALLLGLLLEALVRSGGERPDRRRVRIRLLVGTGALGSFTTYSALASDTVLLGAAGDIAGAVLNGVMTVVVGAFATFVGIRLGVRLRRRPEHGATS